MSELTKEHFDEKLEEIAQVVAKGFESTATKDDMERIEDKVEAMDARLQVIEAKLDRALYTEYINLETRVKRLEQKAGIKTA